MPAALQDHIHLATTLGNGPEFAPTIAWKIHFNEWTPTVIMDPRRTRKGKYHRNGLRAADGTERQLHNWRYVILLTGPNRLLDLVTLVNLNGKLGYLVNSIHVADGENHTPDVRKVAIQIGAIQTDAKDDPGMQVIKVEIALEDNSL